MGLETGDKISDLNPAWPLGTDPKSQGDDHIRLLKTVLQNDATDADTLASTVAQLQAEIAASAALSAPPGVIQAYAADAVPDGWLHCDGAAVSRTTYADLYSALGDVFGAGDGSTTFNLPDLRGEFVRGFDAAAGIDPGRAFGSNQADDFKAHTHGYTRENLKSAATTGIGDQVVSGTSTQQTGSAGGAETRPRNVALRYIIKT